MSPSRIAQWIIGAAGLGLTLLPSAFVFTGKMNMERHQWLMVVGMILWFAVAPYLMRPSSGARPPER